MGDLFIYQFLCSSETIARVVDHHVDIAEIGEGLVHDLTDCLLRIKVMRESEFNPACLIKRLQSIR